MMSWKHLVLYIKGFSLQNKHFFCLIFGSCRYVAVYYSILYFRYRAGTVTDEMLSVPKMPFVIAGVLQALAAAAGMAATGIITLLFILMSVHAILTYICFCVPIS